MKNKWLWIGTRLSDGLLYSRAIPSIDLFFTCDDLICDELPPQKYSLYAEETVHSNKKWTSKDISRVVSRFANEINHFSNEGYNIFPYFLSSEAMSLLHQRNKILNRKISECQITRALQMLSISSIGVRTPRWVVPIGLNWAELTHKLGKRIVFQFDNAVEIGGTFLIDNEDDFLMLSDNFGEADLATEFLEHTYSCSAHLSISHNKIRVIQPSVQFIKEKLVLNNTNIISFTHSGNDFGCYNKNIGNNTDVNNALIKIGKFYQEAGLFGIIGVDFIIQDDDFFYTETNYRLQNSTSLMSFLQSPTRNIVNLLLYDNHRPIDEISQGFQYFIYGNSPLLRSGYYDKDGTYATDIYSDKYYGNTNYYLVFCSEISKENYSIRIVGFDRCAYECGSINQKITEFINKLLDNHKG